MKNIQKYLFLFIVLIHINVYAESTQPSKKQTLPRSEIFPPADGSMPALKGKIIDNRYYSPENLFSCSADAYGKGTYTSQDGLLPIKDTKFISVGFFDSIGNFRVAEIAFCLEELKTFDKTLLKNYFEDMGLGILKQVDNAEGIEILYEELIDKKTLFIAISIKKMDVLTDANGEYMSSTRGYLVSQKENKIILLHNQKATSPKNKYLPKQHIDKLKNDILEFNKSFIFYNQNDSK